jgi:hypothetical protein
MTRGDVDECAREAARALESSRRSCDEPLIATAFTLQPQALTPADLDELAQVVALTRRLGDLALEGYALQNAAERAMMSQDDAIRSKGWEFANAGAIVAGVLGDVSLDAGCRGNAGGAALLSGRSPADAVAELRRSLDAARRIAIPIVIEDLLRLAAAEAVVGHTDTARALYGDWKRLARRFAQGLTPSNQMIIEQFLNNLPTEETAPRSDDRLTDLADSANAAIGHGSASGSAPSAGSIPA